MDILTQKSYIVGIHRYASRAGEPAEIIGLKFVKPDVDYDWRLAFEIEFFDGEKGHVAYTDVIAGHYKIISDVDLIEERIPQVTE